MLDMVPNFIFCVQVMACEAVHPFTGWEDLQQRLASNRRVFGYFHSSLPDEPLVLLHTALMDAVPSAIDDILQGISLWLSWHHRHDAHSSFTDRSIPYSRSIVCIISAGQTSDPGQARVAAFYSISSTQQGLSDLGNFIIKEVL